MPIPSAVTPLTDVHTAAYLTEIEARQAAQDLADDTARNAIVAALADLDQEAREADHMAKVARQRAQQIRASVLAGSFYALGSVLTQSTIDALCECHFSDLAWYLGED